MPKTDPLSAPQATAAAPAPATAATPASSASAAPQTSGATTPNPATAPPAASAEPVDVQDIALQRMEAKLTGNVKEAERLEAILANRPTGAEPEPDLAPVIPDDEAAADEVPAGDTEGDPADTAPADPDTDAPADPEADPDAQDDPDPALDLPKELPNRLRTGHLSKEDRATATAIHALTMGGMSYAAASARILGHRNPAATAADDADPDFAGEAALADEPAQPHPPAPSQALAEMETEVQQLEQQLEEQGDYEGQFNTTIARITAQLSRANARLEAQRSSEQSAAREAQRERASHSKQVETSEAKAYRAYPAALNKESPLYARFLEKCLAANHPSHPDHARSAAADAPEYFLAKAAEELGVKPVAANGRTVPVPPAAAVRGPGPTHGATRPNGSAAAPATRPAPGTKASAPPPPVKTSGQLVEEKKADLESVMTGRKPGSRSRIGGLITLSGS